MSDMVHFYREAETEVYTAGYAAGAATVLRKIPWPEPPAVGAKRWINGFEKGQEAAIEAIRRCDTPFKGANGLAYEGVLELPISELLLTRLYEMVKEYGYERAMEDLGTGRPVDEPTAAEAA